MGSAKKRTATKRASAKPRTAKRPATGRTTAKKPAGAAKRHPPSRDPPAPARSRKTPRVAPRAALDDTGARLAAQLAVIQSVQQALAGGLGLQRVYETV